MWLVRQHYADFGPTLACEYLQRERGFANSVETLRGWTRFRHSTMAAKTRIKARIPSAPTRQPFDLAHRHVQPRRGVRLGHGAFDDLHDHRIKVRLLQTHLHRLGHDRPNKSKGTFESGQKGALRLCAVSPNIQLDLPNMLCNTFRRN